MISYWCETRTLTLSYDKRWKVIICDSIYTSDANNIGVPINHIFRNSQLKRHDCSELEGLCSGIDYSTRIRVNWTTWNWTQCGIRVLKESIPLANNHAWARKTKRQSNIWWQWRGNWNWGKTWISCLSYCESIRVYWLCSIWTWKTPIFNISCCNILVWNNSEW